MNVSMRQEVRVTTDKRREAKCIADALIAYESKVERDGRRWSVHLSASSAPELTAVLTALKDCLDENAMAVVKVMVDDRAYAMEGMT
jgi:hypothetical protein